MTISRNSSLLDNWAWHVCFVGVSWEEVLDCFWRLHQIVHSCSFIAMSRTHWTSCFDVDTHQWFIFSSQTCGCKDAPTLVMLVSNLGLNLCVDCMSKKSHTILGVATQIWTMIFELMNLLVLKSNVSAFPAFLGHVAASCSEDEGWDSRSLRYLGFGLFVVFYIISVLYEFLWISV